MTREKAASYFIVAWVKDWSLWRYCQTVGERVDIDFENLIEVYPWLPKDKYMICRKTSYVRNYTAVNFPKLSTALWDAKDNKARLRLAHRVLKAKSKNVAPFVQNKELRNELRNARCRYRGATGSFFLIKNLAADFNGTNWKQCK